MVTCGVRKMNRREVVLGGVAAAALVRAGALYAAPATRKKLLLVFMRGAYDAAIGAQPARRTDRPSA